MAAKQVKVLPYQVIINKGQLPSLVFNIPFPLSSAYCKGKMKVTEAIQKEPNLWSRILTHFDSTRTIDHIVANHLKKDVTWIRENKKEAERLLKQMFACLRCKEKK